MRRLVCTTVVVGLAVILFTASWRLVAVSQPVEETVDVDAESEASTILTQRLVALKNEGTTEVDFQSEFLTLLAPFEGSEIDLFAREKRAAAFQACVERMGSFQIPMAFEMIALMEGRESTEARQDLLARVAQRWAELDPSAAAAGVARLAADLEEPCRRVATAWARSDARDAIAWAESLNDVAAREAALTAIAQENAIVDPITTLPLLPQIGAADDGVVDDAMRSWMERDLDAALSWSERMEAGPLREEVFAGVAAALSDSDPIEAATIAIREVKGTVQRDNLVLGIVQRWGAKDFSAAEAWVNEFPESELRERALTELKRVVGQ